jgi:hypothetical protein
MAAFTFTLELADGTPADPPTLKAAVPDWRPGDTIPLGPGRTLRVVATVASKDGEPSVLVVEDTAERASGDPA